jgi:hypothetical protein
VRIIEDRLYLYRTKQDDQLQSIPVGKAVHRQLQRAQELARDLRGLLLVCANVALVVRPIARGVEAWALEGALYDQLARAIARWQQLAERLQQLPKHRPPDHELWWLALAVVRALADAGVPLKLGHRTTVVEVLGLVRCWATERPRRRHRWSNEDYQFARVIVEIYRRNQSRNPPKK